MDGFGIALAFALTSVPAFLVARSLARSHARDLQAGPGVAGASGRLARLMNSVGIALLIGAAGMAWAVGDTRRTLIVASALALIVNGLALAMLVAVLRSRRSRR